MRVRSSLMGWVMVVGIASPSSSSALAPRSLSLKIEDAAQRAYVDPKLLEALIKVESNFKPYATSPKGAMGLMQVMPKTADFCGVKHAYHALNNLMGATACLRKLINKYDNKLELALAAYNAGPTAVAKYKGIPPYPETQTYVKKIMKLYKKLQEEQKPLLNTPK